MPYKDKEKKKKWDKENYGKLREIGFWGRYYRENRERILENKKKRYQKNDHI